MNAQQKNEPIGQIEQWPEPVDASCIDDAVHDLVKHVLISEENAYKCVLWSGHADMYEVWDKSPRLLLTAPMKACGKSTLLNVVAHMTDRRLEAGSCTPAAFVNYAAKQRQVFFIDEADAIFSKRGSTEMTTVLNIGYEQGKPYHKTSGDNHDPKAFPVYSAAALAGIGLETKMSDTTLSRSIVIRMEKAKKGQLSERYKRKKHQQKFLDHGRKIKRWVQDNTELIEAQEPRFFDDVDDRVEDNWTPLLAIAQVHSDTLAQRVRRMAMEDAGSGNEDVGLLLVKDLYTLYQAKKEALPSEWQSNVSVKGIGPEAARLAIMELHTLDDRGERPWENFHPERLDIARQIQATEVSKYLKNYGISKKSIRAGTSIYAYQWQDIEYAYHQYLSDEEIPNVDKLEEVDESSQRSSVVDVVDCAGVRS